MTGWECSFCRSKSKVPVIRSTQTVVQLLHGFFTYYNKFDFSNNVVCPLIGHPVRKHYFYKPQDLPYAMDSYVSRVTKSKHAEKFRTKCYMCVQDPFDLSHNLTKGTSQAILNKFKILCSHTADLCAKFCHWTVTRLLHCYPSFISVILEGSLWFSRCVSLQFGSSVTWHSCVLFGKPYMQCL